MGARQGMGVRTGSGPGLVLRRQQPRDEPDGPSYPAATGSGRLVTTPSALWSGVTIDCVDPQRLGRFWAALLRRTPSASLPGWVRLGDASDGLPLINFQPVPEPKRGKTRIHLDVTVADIDKGVAMV